MFFSSSYNKNIKLMPDDRPRLSSDPDAPSASDQRKKAGLHGLIIAEPAMFLFMCSALAKFPIFQSLLYEKACYNSGRFDRNICQNISAIHADLELQKEANHLLLASSFCLLLPSIPSSLVLGAMFDSYSTRKSLIIPLAGLLLADLNYVLQSFCPECSAYWLLLSDICYGLAGGFTSIIGLLFAYSVRITSPAFRSSRVALMEGSMGLGGMVGYILSGQLRQKFGYAWVFLLLAAFHLFILLHILLFLRELVTPHTLQPDQRSPITSRDSEQAQLDSASIDSNHRVGNNADSNSFLHICRTRLANIGRVYRTERDPTLQKCLNFVLLALAIEFVSFSGLMDILFSFLRFQLQWTDKEYGWFNGIGMGLASVCVILLYPLLLKRAGVSDLRLSLFGLLAKIVSILILAFSHSTLTAMLSIIPSAFGRFVSTGLRAMASVCVAHQEQGKIFSLISLIEALAFLLASLLFNGLYPYTLDLFPGTMLMAIVLCLMLPVGMLVYIDAKGIGKRPEAVEESDG